MWHLRGQSVELLDVIGKMALVDKADLIRNLTDGQNAGVLSALPPLVRLGRPHNSISKPHGRCAVRFCASEPNLAEFFVPEAGPKIQTRAERETDAVPIWCSSRMISAARSPTITQGAMVLPVVTRGMIDPSAMRRLSTP